MSAPDFVRTGSCHACRSFALPLLGLLSLAAGCADAPVVRELPAWNLEEELRIGSLDDPEQALTYVGTLLVGPSGEVYVAQPQDRCIRVYSASGRLLRTIGREGQGPGEIQAIAAMGWHHDTLYVSDSQNQRITLFNADGSHARTIPTAWPVIEGVFLPRGVSRLLDDGTALLQPSFPSQALAEGTVKARPLFRVDSAGQVLARVAEVPMENSQIAIQRGTGALYTSQLFSDDPILALSPSGDFVVVVERPAATGSDDAVMRVTRLSVDGDTAFTREIRYQPVPLPSELLDSLVDARAESLSGILGSAQEARRALDQHVFRPAHYPPATSVLITEDDGILLRREAAPGDQARWDVLTSDGVPVGKLSLPSTARVLHATETELWTSERDALDVPYVVRYGVRQE